MNTFFNDYINLKTYVKQFIKPSNNFLKRKVENETAIDFNSFHTQYPRITHYSMKKQFQLLYTNAKFKKVKDEFCGFLYVNIS